jgi:Ca2+-binding EF-hand superfamily protein
MQKHILIAATAALLSLPLALSAADEAKKKGPFMAADTDNDGKVTLAEYVAAVKGKQDEAAAKAKFAELDTDKNGSLSREEFNAGAGGKKGEKKKKDGN